LEELITFTTPLELEVASIHIQYKSPTGIKHIEEVQWKISMIEQLLSTMAKYHLMYKSLCFLGVIAAKHISSTALDDINEAGMYAIVHFVDQMCSVANHQDLYRNSM